MKTTVALLVGLLFGAGSAVAAEPRALRIVTLHTVLTEIAREVGGDKVTVTGLVGPGVDPHTFDPSAADIRIVADADLVLASGLHLETYLDRLATQAGASGHVCLVGDALPLVLSFAGGGPESGADRALLSATGEKDPHWWHSIGNVVVATDLVRAQMTRLRPASADVFAHNAQAYEQRLLALKSWVTHEVAKIPPARRQLVTSHNAFGYFGRDYGFTIHSLGGVSTEAEPDAKQLAHLIDIMRAGHIRAVFAESGDNPRLVETLMNETGARRGDALYADGLGPPGSDATSYEAMYRHNVRAIVGGLMAP